MKAAEKRFLKNPSIAFQKEFENIDLSILKKEKDHTKSLFMKHQLMKIQTAVRILANLLLKQNVWSTLRIKKSIIKPN